MPGGTKKQANKQTNKPNQTKPNQNKTNKQNKQNNGTNKATNTEGRSSTIGGETRGRENITNDMGPMGGWGDANKAINTKK